MIFKVTVFFLHSKYIISVGNSKEIASVYFLEKKNVVFILTTKFILRQFNVDVYSWVLKFIYIFIQPSLNDMACIQNNSSQQIKI